MECPYIVRMCREYITPSPTIPAIDASSMGLLRDHDDGDEALMLAALDEYESTAGKVAHVLT